MISNSSMTQYTKVYNKTTRLEEWERIQHKKVFWTGGKGARLNKGLEQSNDVKVRVPLNTSFKVGDIIVKGLTNKDYNQEDYYTVTSVVINDYSKTGIDHIHLEAK